MIASAAYQAGQLLGFVVLLIVVVGLVRTFTRSDLTLREKILGKRRSESPISVAPRPMTRER